MVSGAPSYNPDSAKIMSSNAYAALFQGLGSSYQIRNSGPEAGSGSGAGREEIAESAAPQVRVDSVQDPEVVVDNMQIDAGADRIQEQVSKKRKSVPTKSRKGKEPAIKKFVCDGQGVNPDGKEAQVGNHTLQELAQFMIDIPTDEEMAERKESGLHSVLKRVVGHWGQVGF